MWLLEGRGYQAEGRARVKVCLRNGQVSNVPKVLSISGRGLGDEVREVAGNCG